MDFSSIDNFGCSAPSMRIGFPRFVQKRMNLRGGLWRRFSDIAAFVWLWRLFNRNYADGRGECGFGILQVEYRHLFYVGASRQDDAIVWRLCVGFVWLIGRAP